MSSRQRRSSAGPKVGVPEPYHSITSRMSERATVPTTLTHPSSEVRVMIRQHRDSDDSSEWRRESTDMYYNDTPDTVAARNPLYAAFRQLSGLDNVKADLENIITASAAGMRHTASSNDVLRGDSPVSFHRYIFGPPGMGRRLVAQVYSDVYLALGLVKGRESKVVSVASLSENKPYEEEVAFRKSLSHDGDIGVFIIEDIYDTALMSRRTISQFRTVVRSAVTSTLDQPHARREGPIFILVSDDEISRDVLLPVTSLHESYRQLFVVGNQFVPLSPYTTQELLDILVARLRNETGLELELGDAENESLAIKLRNQLDTARLRPGFDNARYAGRLARMAAVHYHSRLTSSPNDIEHLQESDFEDTNTTAGKASSVEWRDGIVGNAGILLELETIRRSANAMRYQQLPNHAQFFPHAFILCGDAGTGKTTLARTALAKLYYQLGFLDTYAVVCPVLEIMPSSHFKLSDTSTLELYADCRSWLEDMMESALGKLLLIQNQEPITVEDVEPLAVIREIMLSCIKDLMAPPHGEYMQKLVVVWEERSTTRVPRRGILDSADSVKFFRQLNCVPINEDATVVELFRQHMALANLSVEEVSLADDPTDPEADNGGIPMRILLSGHSRNRWDLIGIANEIIQDAYNTTGTVKILIEEADGRFRVVLVSRAASQLEEEERYESFG